MQAAVVVLLTAVAAWPVGAVDVPVAGKKAKLRATREGVPKRLAIVLRDEAITTPLPDPRLGATLRIHGTPEAGQCATRIDLEAAGWTERRGDGAARGYRYRAAAPGTQGVRSVTLRPGRLIVKGKGAALPCDLAAASQHTPLVVEFAAGDHRYCAEFGGTIKRNETGRFAARRTDRPAACPSVRLNVVMLFADDLGYADVGVQGGTAVPTPHIDGLAATGVRFTDAYATGGTCGPSRVGLVTGRYQQRFGFEFNTGGRGVTHEEGRGLPPPVTTISDAFRDGGYATGMVGKWHLGSQDQFHPIERGFGEFFGFLIGAHPYFPDGVGDRETFETMQRGKERWTEPEYLTDAFAREAIDFIDRHRAVPFFLYVPFNAVHTPLEASDEYLDRFSGVTDPEQRAYFAMTSALDDAVGDVLQALDDAGLADDTVVVFTNDNGGLRRLADNGPLRLGKSFLFEGGIRVPLIVRWPGVSTPGQVQTETVSLLDLFPTLLGAAGLPAPGGVTLDGVDLGPHLRGTASGAAHDALFWRNGPNRAVRRGDWKLVQAHDHVWLFDLATDPGEVTNLAADRPEIVAELLAAFDAWASEMSAPLWPSRPGNVVLVDGVPYEIHI